MNQEWLIDRICQHNLVRILASNEITQMQYYDQYEMRQIKDVGSAARVALCLSRNEKLEDDWYIGLYACPIYGNEIDGIDGTTAYYQLLTFNRRFREILTERARLMGPTYGSSLLAVIEESEYLYKVYDILDDISRPNYKLYRRRAALGRLRAMIGDHNFENGFLPPHVPIDKFIIID